MVRDCRSAAASVVGDYMIQRVWVRGVRVSWRFIIRLNERRRENRRDASPRRPPEAV